MKCTPVAIASNATTKRQVIGDTNTSAAYRTSFVQIWRPLSTYRLLFDGIPKDSISLKCRYTGVTRYRRVGIPTPRGSFQFEYARCAWDFFASESGDRTWNYDSVLKRILRSVMTAVGKGRFSEVVRRFDDHFTFTDQALDLDFTDKKRLIEFFRKSRESLPIHRVEAHRTRIKPNADGWSPTCAVYLA